MTEINHDYLTSEQGRKLTRDIPAGRFGQDGDLDGALLLLVSDAGAYMAGATVVVDGGQMVALRG
jgi:3-oxoacyl-[acyl-carrier protein] reductase